MKWETRKISEKSWGVFLMKKFCKTKDPVCYGTASLKKSADFAVKRLNKEHE
tara:strand:+ start:412 stop:567 length:156 start_codon:yes stop_codon:yes gene_type:complete